MANGVVTEGETDFFFLNISEAYNLLKNVLFESRIPLENIVHKL